MDEYDERRFQELYSKVSELENELNEMKERFKEVSNL